MQSCWPPRSPRAVGRRRASIRLEVHMQTYGIALAITVLLATTGAPSASSVGPGGGVK